MTPSIAAIIVGIDGWEKYTLPLIESIHKHEPECSIAVIDNASKTPYPRIDFSRERLNIHRTERLSYSAAINYGKSRFWTHSIGSGGIREITYDWYIVLSNDVLCTGPFAHVLEGYSDDSVVGPLLLETLIPHLGMIPYLEGWCMAFSKRCWNAIDGFDEGYLMSSFEDVDASQEARKAGFGLVEDKELLFKHLDQKQRFYLPGYGGSEEHNMRRFMAKNGVTA